MPKKSLNLEPIAFRIATIVAGAILVTVLLLTATWFLGDSIASASDIPEILEYSKSMSPGNPKPFLALSALREQSFRQEDLKAALEDAGIAVSYSPHDYMSWRRLGRLRERTGDIEGAEKALRKALVLAPNHASVQWSLGNLLLRQDKNEEAFRLMRLAVEQDRTYAGPAASIAWDIYDGDIEKVKSSIGNSNRVQVALAVYLSKLKRFREAVEIWKSVPAAARKGNYANEGREILGQLVGETRFLAALEIAKDLQAPGEPEPKAGSVTNGGFESQVGKERPEFYEWLIAEGDVPRIGVSVEEKSSGAHSLAFFFEDVLNVEFRNVSQTVALPGGLSYTLTARYKSKLKTDATLAWQVADTAGSGILATSEPIEKEGDWETVEVSFDVPEDSQGVVIRLIRVDCGRLRCPIVGTVWFDDIEVK